MINSIGRIPAEAARLCGDKTALVFPNMALSFNELDALTNQCANVLVNIGVEPGDRITLYSSNCWEWIVSYYGALKTGAVINPINVMLTPGEVEFVANDCTAAVVIAAQRTDRNIDIKYTLKPLCPTQWRAMQCLIDRGFSGRPYCRLVRNCDSRQTSRQSNTTSPW